LTLFKASVEKNEAETRSIGEMAGTGETATEVRPQLRRETGMGINPASSGQKKVV